MEWMDSCDEDSYSESENEDDDDIESILHMIVMVGISKKKSIWHQKTCVY